MYTVQHSVHRCFSSRKITIVISVAGIVCDFEDDTECWRLCTSMQYVSCMSRIEVKGLAIH